MPIRILRADREFVPLPGAAGEESRAIVWPGMGARAGTIHFTTVQPGHSTQPRRFPNSELSFYAMQGRGKITDLDLFSEHPFDTMDMAHVLPGVLHQVANRGTDPLIIIGGPCPPEPALYENANVSALTSSVGGSQASALDQQELRVRILCLDKDYVELPLIVGAKAKFLVWPGMGAKYRSMNYVTMKAGQENVPHSHLKSEDFFYCLSGNCVIADLETGEEHPFGPGDVIYIDVGVPHAVKSFGPTDYISVGGPCPPDYEFFRRAGIKW